MLYYVKNTIVNVYCTNTNHIFANENATLEYQTKSNIQIVQK